ncbi:MAG: endonuclease/exonuclease/phosphatase family protein [Verrucomicrobiota bacterium]|nr:endonuclease/exonuclease/phosphatase family protein [Verrucomicrobiota bacterium]
MTFNIWVGGSAGKQPIEQTTEVIRKSKADIVGMQETRVGGKDSSQLIADSLGWLLFAQGGYTSFLSRYPIV